MGLLGGLLRRRPRLADRLRNELRHERLSAAPGVAAAHGFLGSWWMVAAAIAFSIAVSLAAGLYPASRAARLNPVEALRYE